MTDSPDINVTPPEVPPETGETTVAAPDNAPAWYAPRRFLRGHFLLAAAVIGTGASMAVEWLTTDRSDEAPARDRLTALFSPASDPVLNKPYFFDREVELNSDIRHNMMMQDTAQAAALKKWLGQLDPYLEADPVTKLDALRRLVQESVRYAFDDRVYGVDEYVAAPLQTMQGAFGDCDDFTDVYYLGARYLGFSADKCFKAVVGTKGEVGNHRVALIDTSATAEKRMLSKNIFVLDNGGPLKHLEETDFVPYLLINREGSRVVMEGVRRLKADVETDINEQGLQKYVRTQMERPEVRDFFRKLGQ